MRSLTSLFSLASLDDYELLEKLNQLTRQKYSEMNNVTKGLITRMEQINEKCKFDN